MDGISLILQKIMWNIREHGLPDLLRRAAAAATREILQGEEHAFWVDCGDLPEANANLQDGLEVLTFDRRGDIPPEHLEDLRKFVWKRYMGEEIIAHYLDQLLSPFSRRGRLYLARLDGRIAAILWSFRSEDDYFENFRHFPLVEGDAVLGSGHTLPDFRGRGMVPALVRAALLHLKTEGALRVYASCKVWNTASQRCISKGRMRWFGTGRPFSLLGKRLTLWSKGGPAR